jgi:hypothetical protein
VNPALHQPVAPHGVHATFSVVGRERHWITPSWLTSQASVGAHSTGATGLQKLIWLSTVKQAPFEPPGGSASQAGAWRSDPKQSFAHESHKQVIIESAARAPAMLFGQVD